MKDEEIQEMVEEIKIAEQIKHRITSNKFVELPEGVSLIEWAENNRSE
jgi:hypothetical protein